MSTEMLTKTERPSSHAHWENAHANRGAACVWYESTARVSLKSNHDAFGGTIVQRLSDSSVRMLPNPLSAVLEWRGRLRQVARQTGEALALAFEHHRSATTTPSAATA